MKILFAGPNWYGSNSRSMAVGLRLAGHDVRIVDTTPVSKPRRFSSSWMRRRIPAWPGTDDAVAIAEALEAQAKEWRPDVLFAFKTVMLDQDRLLSLPISWKIHYSPDDVSNPENTSPDYLAHEAGWSLVVTTKSHNVDEIVLRSGTTAVMVWSAYDPGWHHPKPALPPYRQAKAGFIGNARPDRIKRLQGLVDHFGREFLLAGERWKSQLSSRGNGARIIGPQYGEAFSSTVSQIGANIVLLNSENRDRHTCRTFEVPAAGGLVVAERTNEHETLFEEGKEAYFFDSDEGLLDIVERVGRSPAVSRRVQEAGTRAILGGQHTYQDRAREILVHLA